MIDHRQIELVDVTVSWDGFLKCSCDGIPLDEYPLIGQQIGPVDPHIGLRIMFADEVPPKRSEAQKDNAFMLIGLVLLLVGGYVGHLLRR